MLPWELAVYRVRRGRALPVFRDLSGRNWELAQSVIDTFRAHVGKTKRELAEKLEELTLAPDYRFVKGLIRIMERRCVFEEGEDAAEFRMKVFRRYPGNPEQRAKELGMSVDEMLARMFADINPRLLKVMDITANELLMEYNLSLAQTMLFRATRMEVRFSEPQVYRALKFFGLIYRMDSENHVTVDGPVSIFSQTTRYGTRFARLLPFIVHREPWSIRASLRLKDVPAILELEHLRHGYYFPRKIEDMEDDVKIDLKNYHVERFEKPVKVGEEYRVPSYRVRCDDFEFYIELFKFWSWRYIEKIARDAMESHAPILFLLNRKGNVMREDGGDMPNVLFFRDRIDEELLMKAKRALGSAVLETESSRERKESEVIRIDSIIVERGELDKLAEKLRGVELYSEAELIIERENLPVMEVLHFLGYRIVWRGLEPYKIKKGD